MVGRRAGGVGRVRAQRVTPERPCVHTNKHGNAQTMVAPLHRKVTRRASRPRYTRRARRRKIDLPAELQAFMAGGTVRQREETAAQDAIRSERKYCLQELERLRAELPADSSIGALTYLEDEITRLRRVLGIAPTPERIREQTRERVRRYRERQQRN